MKKHILSLTLVLSSLFSLNTTSILAQNFSYFTKSPRLTEAMTTFSMVRAWNSTYYFTIQIPENAGNDLKTVTIKQREGFDFINFYLDKTVAFQGTHNRKKTSIPIESITQDTESHLITIQLKDPVSPNSVFTVGLKPKQNPDTPGVYLFGVTVYPMGENPSGLYLGVGRLQFYQGGNGLF
jgi:hypothetical protein